MKNKRIIIFSLVLVIVFSLGLSYAYFTGGVKGERKNINISSNDIKILFTDSTSINEENITPGWSTSKTFSVENQSNTIFNYNIVFKDLINTFVTEGGLQYKITSDNGFNMTEYVDVPKSDVAKDVTLAYDIDVEVGIKHEYTIEFRYYDDPDKDQTEDTDKEFSGTLAIVENGNLIDYTKSKYLYGKLLADHGTRLTRTDFNNVLTTENTKTLYIVDGNFTENGKTVYYFAGNALDNWIKFGKDSSGQDLYWRIIRTNEDGSVRLLYVGTSMNTTAGYINASQAYNSSYSDPMFVGYMYGTRGSLANNRKNTNDSVIKTTIDNWYNESINTKTDSLGNKYDKYVSRTAIYCNDRANEGYSTSSTFYYAGYKRFLDAKQPSYKCGNNSSGSLYTGTNGAGNADRFSASTSSSYTNGVSVGNGDLTYPAALMSADEVVFAGGVYGINATTWYYYNSTGGSVAGSSSWWLMSPSHWTGRNANAFYIIGSNFPGALNNAFLTGTLTVRPVLSLKSCTTWVSGDGSVNSPYEVKINSECASRDN